MKNIIKLIIATIFFQILWVSSIDAQRNTLWMRGTTQNSNGWGAVKSSLLINDGYQFDDLIYSDLYNLSVGVTAASDALAGTFGSNEDILGIAHDYGGLVLRHLQLQEPNISAMILNGVPNQGSSALSFATTSSPGDESRAEKLINRIEQIQGPDNCEDCGLLEAFRSWVESLNAGSSYLCDAKAGSSIIDDLNDNMPTVPFAILWGSDDEFSITRMMSSNAFPSNNDYLTECYTQQLEEARQDAKEALIRRTITNTLNFLGEVANAIGSIIGAGDKPNPADIISAVVDLVNATQQNTLNEIEAVKEHDEELARVLRCEFSNQLLAAEWQLGIMENAFQTEEVDWFYSEQQCEAICNQQGWEDWYLMHVCIPDCMDEPHPGTALVVPENDGLLTKAEQLLEGNAGEPYHLANTNHFQETSVYNAALHNALTDLFDGGAGAAFIIPK